MWVKRGGENRQVMWSAWVDIHAHTCVGHTRTVEFYGDIKNKKIASTGEWVDLEGIVLSEISQAQEDILSVVYPVWDLEEEIEMEVRGGGHLETREEKEGKEEKG